LVQGPALIVESLFLDGLFFLRRVFLFASLELIKSLTVMFSSCPCTHRRIRARASSSRWSRTSRQRLACRLLVHQEGELGRSLEPARFAPADSMRDDGIRVASFSGPTLPGYRLSS
jgi:hypothetical protein